MFAFTGIAAHVLDCAVQEPGELLLFVFGEVLHQLFLIGENDAVHGFLALPALGKDIDALAPPVAGVRAEFDEFLLFQTGQQAGDRGVAEVEGFLDVPGTGRVLPVSEKAHDVALGCGQIHGGQGIGHGLVRENMEHPEQMAIVRCQRNHLQ